MFSNPQKVSFLILKVLFLRKQLKHHSGFIYHTKYKSSWATLNAMTRKKPGVPNLQHGCGTTENGYSSLRHHRRK